MIEVEKSCIKSYNKILGDSPSVYFEKYTPSLTSEGKAFKNYVAAARKASNSVSVLQNVSTVLLGLDITIRGIDCFARGYDSKDDGKAFSSGFKAALWANVIDFGAAKGVTALGAVSGVKIGKNFGGDKGALVGGMLGGLSFGVLYGTFGSERVYNSVFNAIYNKVDEK